MESCADFLFKGTFYPDTERGQAMTEQKPASRIDFEVLRRAEEQRDLDAMLDLYAGDPRCVS